MAEKPTTSGKARGVDQILQRWRKEIKGKSRRIISFEETVALKIESIKNRIYYDFEPVAGWTVRQFNFTSKRERAWVDDDFRPIHVGDTWGGPDMSALFRCTAVMPERFAGKKVALKVYFGGDGLLSVNGTPYHGLDPFRDTVILSGAAEPGTKYDFEVESFIFWHFGEGEIKTFESSHFALVDDAMNDAYWDLRAAYNVMIAPQTDADVRAFIVEAMTEAVAHINQNETDNGAACEGALKAQQIIRKKVYTSDRFKKDGLIHLCANSHLDVVFLWTHAEFVRKLGRTHATTLRLMEQYPDYIFSQSQALMYDEMKKQYPALYEQVKQRVAEGRWEVIGAFWVVPDCNLISGESFVRQTLHGVRFFEREFGITPRTCWMPDVFGNAWGMPQILVQCGLDYFVTHKMVVWNDTNPWTRNTFWWQGPDGTRILSVVPPTHFIGTVEPDHMAEHWEGFGDKTTIGESLYNYGWGDGGGGPDPEMIEYVKRYQDFPGVVPAKPCRIEEALDSIGDRAATADIPVWNDELYLEEHRGTFTTKGRLKKLNRRCEHLYRAAEMFATFAGGTSGGDYPRETLNEGWIEVLNNQFHDSLPGSHITPVYGDLLASYDKAISIGEGVLNDALTTITQRADTNGEGEALVVFNAQPRTRSTIAQVIMDHRDVHVTDSAGNVVVSQWITDSETGKPVLAFEANDLPPVGYKVFRLLDGKTESSNVKATSHTLENNHLRVQINDDGEVVSLVDKATGHDYFSAERPGNVLKLYEDVPGKYEAWDIAPSYTDIDFDTGQATVTIDEQGPLRSSLKVTRMFGNSSMTQRIVLTRDGKRIDFITDVDWAEQQKLLKTRFFTDLVTRTATYDMPYGNIERSAYRNHSYDAAKFEVPGHTWMDLSQADHGLSLLNDCKYGHEAFDGMMALTLLRGPTNPDPASDQEHHQFTYSLYPHTSTWREGGTIERAADLNDPVRVVVTDVHEGDLPAEHSFLSLDTDGVTLEAVKRAEDSDDLIVRIVERLGATQNVTIRLAASMNKAALCNPLEHNEQPIDTNGDALTHTLRPYQMQTFKLSM